MAPWDLSRGKRKIYSQVCRKFSFPRDNWSFWSLTYFSLIICKCYLIFNFFLSLMGIVLCYLLLAAPCLLFNKLKYSRQKLFMSSYHYHTSWVAKKDKIETTIQGNNNFFFFFLLFFLFLEHKYLFFMYNTLNHEKILNSHCDKANIFIW